MIALAVVWLLFGVAGILFRYLRYHPVHVFELWFVMFGPAMLLTAIFVEMEASSLTFQRKRKP